MITEMGGRRKDHAAEADRVLEWYRVDQTAQVLWAFGVGALSVALGTGLSFLAATVARSMSSYSTLWIAGLCLIVAGPLGTMAALRRVLREDRYVALRADGIFVHLSAPGTLITWDGFQEAEVDAEGRLRLTDESGLTQELWARLDGIDPTHLTQRIGRVRTQALMGLL